MSSPPPLRRIFPGFFFILLAAALGPQEARAIRPMVQFHDLVAGAGDPGFRDGTFVQALFQRPSGLALDPDGSRLFVADTENHSIRIIDLNQDNQVSTLAGKGGLGKENGPLEKATFNKPLGLIYLPGGRLVVNDTGNQFLRIIDLTKKTVTTLAGNGTGTGPLEGDALQVALGQITSLVYFPSENSIYFSHSSTLSRLDLKTNKVSTVSEGQPPLQRPGALCLRNNRLCVADRISTTVYEIEPSGNTLPGQTRAAFKEIGSGQGKEILSMASDNGVLYALQSGDHPLVQLAPYRPVSLMTAWGTFLDDVEYGRPKFLSFRDPNPCLISDPLHPKKFFVSWPDSHNILSFRDYAFDDNKNAEGVNPNGLSDFDYPAKKPAHTFRVLIVGDSKTFVTSQVEKKKWGFGYNRMENVSKRLELMLNTWASLEDKPLNYEVLNAARLATDPNALCVWSYYLVPDLVKKFDIDLVLYVTACQTYPMLCDPWFQRPLTPEGVPALGLDPTFLLKPVAEKIPKGVPERFFKRALEKNFVKVTDTKIDFVNQDWILTDEALKKDAELLLGKPLGLLAGKIKRIRNSDGNPVPFWMCFVPVGDHGNTPLETYRGFWKDLCSQNGVPLLDLTEPFLALSPSYFPISESGLGDHLTGNGYTLFAYILGHDLISRKMIPTDR